MPQKLRCEVTKIINHGERVYSVFLKPETPAPRFQPGQFLHLALDPYSPGDFWPDSRVFSIASSHTERDLLCITYAVKGQFTSRMEDELQVGSEVWLKMPYGEFVIRTDSDICMLAGGTGITAFTSFLAGSLSANYPDTPRQGFPHAVYLFYGARCPELLIYRSLVETVAQECTKLRPVFLSEKPCADCLTGRISLDLVWNTLPDPQAVAYYLAGPPEMLHALVGGLLQRGVVENRLIRDAWE